MLVKELIAQLLKLNPDAVILVADIDPVDEHGVECLDGYGCSGVFTREQAKDITGYDIMSILAESEEREIVVLLQDDSEL